MFGGTACIFWNWPGDCQLVIDPAGDWPGELSSLIDWFAELCVAAAMVTAAAEGRTGSIPGFCGEILR
jgi:hypothetical protein